MLYSLGVHRIDAAREDVYLASVQDQEAVIASAEGFRGRMLLRSQVDGGVFWLLDAWSDEDAMRYALAAARTLASVAALIEEPREVLLQGAGDSAGGSEGFFLGSESWVKQPCLHDYEQTVRDRGESLGREPGFRSRLLLADRADELHRFVVDHWSSERDAHAAYQRRQVPEVEATRFLSLLAERGRPLLASGLQIGGARHRL